MRPHTRTRKRIYSIALGFVLSISAGVHNFAGAGTLDDLISEALAQNPDIRAAEQRWHLYQQKIPSASSFDDPRLTLALNNYPLDTLNWDQTPMTGQVVRLTQNLPFPGKLAAKGEIAAQQAAWYREVYGEAQLQLIRQVKEAWYGLYLQERILERTDSSLKLVDDFISLTINRYETGKGIQQDVLKAQVERSILHEKRLAIIQLRNSALANLNTLRNQAAETPVSVPADLLAPAQDYFIESLLAGPEQERPLARAYRSLIAQYEAQQELARLNYYPDFSLGGAYTFRQSSGGDSGTDFGSIDFSINLPLFNKKRRAAEAEAAAARTMAQNQYNDFLLKARYAIFDIYGQMEKNQKLTNLYKQGILPQARQSLEAAVSSYQANRISFLALLDTMLTLYKYEVEYFRTIADHGRSIARLEAEAGLTAGLLAALPRIETN
jgi:cobalt-zinc-cadmium efflux system outer membrane protein